MLKKWLALLSAMVLVLTACHSKVYDQTQNNVANVKIRASAARAKSDKSAKLQPSLLVKQGLYVDTTPISLERDPSWLRNHIVIRGDRLPFSYYSRTISAGASSNMLTKFQTGLDPTVNVTLSYAGSVKGALDLLAAKTGFVYNVRGHSIYWQAFVTKTFDIAFMPGSSDYLMGKASGSTGTTASTAQSPGGGGGGGGGNSSPVVANYTTSDSSESEYSSLSGKLSIWKDLDETIRQLLSPEGKVTVSQATTTVTVRDKPTNVQLISQYIHNLNNNLSRQVLVKVQVMEVTLENDYEFGIDWQMIARAFHNTPFVVNANYGTPVSITSFTPQATVNGVKLPTPQFGFNAAQNPGNPNGVPSYTVLFNALNQQGKTSVVSEPRVVCLNNQVSVIRIVKQEGYLASVQNTSLSSGSATNIGVGTVTSQLTPGMVITGLTLYILPKIMRNNVYLQVNADLSTAAPFKTFISGSGANSSQIQLPEVSVKNFNQRSMIRSGDTLILSGFRQVKNTANANQFLTSQALGGKGSQQVNTETIVLITPIVLDGSA